MQESFDNIKSSFQNINDNELNDMNKFRYGTKFIRFIVRNNYDSEKNVTTSYKDFYIKEIIE